MTDPYAAIDANYDKMYDMADPEVKRYESIRDQLLSVHGVADYHDNKGKYQMSFRSELLEEDYAEQYEEGGSIIRIMEAEAKRIAESIF